MGDLALRPVALRPADEAVVAIGPGHPNQGLQLGEVAGAVVPLDYDVGAIGGSGDLREARP
jgi:hypothetical protein